jgi:hypothetical protein
MLSVLLLGFGTAMAATAGLDNVPGGAGVAYWQAGPGGVYTLLNIQNVADNTEVGFAAITIHIAFYDRDSNHLLDFIVPMSPRDNWGASITGDGTTITVTPQAGLAFAGYAPPATWQVATAGVGPANLQFGYVTVAITRMDNPVALGNWRINPPGGGAIFVGNGNGNPIDDPEMANAWTVLPDMLILRSAVLTPGSALGFNGNMLQGFLNRPNLSEDGSGLEFVNTIGADALCAPLTVDWDNSGTFQIGPVALTDVGGILIHASELYVSDAILSGLIVADGCTRAGRRVALGSGDGIYWARYNVTPGLTESTLMMIAPANSNTPENPGRNIADVRIPTITAYDDNENWVSTPFAALPEVSLSPLYSTTNPPLPGNTSIQHSTFVSGELRIQMAAPLFGWIATVINGVEADLYPLFKDRVNVNVVDLGAPDWAAPATSNVRQLGY